MFWKQHLLFFNIRPLDVIISDTTQPNLFARKDFYGFYAAVTYSNGTSKKKTNVFSLCSCHSSICILQQSMEQKNTFQTNHYKIQTSSTLLHVRV